MQLLLQVERSIFTLIQPPLSEKIGTSPEPPKIFMREGSYGLIFDTYVWDDIFLHLNIPFWTMPDKNLRSSVYSACMTSIYRPAYIYLPYYTDSLIVSPLKSDISRMAR